MELNDISGSIKTTKKQTVSGQIEHVVMCGCWECLAEMKEQTWQMVVCVECGNKRCPHAADHKNKCTNSNDTGQVGSIYT